MQRDTPATASRMQSSMVGGQEGAAVPMEGEQDQRHAREKCASGGKGARPVTHGAEFGRCAGERADHARQSSGGGGGGQPTKARHPPCLGQSYPKLRQTGKCAGRGQGSPSCPGTPAACIGDQAPFHSRREHVGH